MSLQAIDWKINYSAVFAPKTKNQFEAWAEFLAANVRGDDLTKDEIDEAVAELCERWHDLRNHPKVTDILAIINRKRRERDPTRWRRINTTEDDHLRLAKRQIETESDYMQIWELICGKGRNVSECKELETFAAEAHPKFTVIEKGRRKFRRPTKADFVKAGAVFFTDLVARGGGGLRNVSRELATN